MFYIQRAKRLVAGLACLAMLAPVVVVVPCPLSLEGFAEPTLRARCNCWPDNKEQAWTKCRHSAWNSSGKSKVPIGCFESLPSQNELPMCSSQLN